jgi:putative peptidoglycan lipid II flippase
MSLLKNVGTIGGLTAVSRVFGFARDMLLARTLGTGLAADAFQLAFTLPNTFRRLFAEGAFSVAFVPMYSRALHGENGEEAAEKFAGDVLAVFVWVLLAFSAVAMIAMPAIEASSAWWQCSRGCSTRARASDQAPSRRCS